MIAEKIEPNLVINSVSQVFPLKFMVKVFFLDICDFIQEKPTIDKYNVLFLQYLLFFRRYTGVLLE